ncbi:MAG: PTS sugar transporter subunit IIA [Chitinispirillales bacterium]|nr:PTS sugar transporter subunit IIA [Chitinispirillales bacterium]
MKIQELIKKNSIIIDLKASDKTEALNSIARFLCSINGLTNTEEICAKIIERETEMSTGIGFGIAIPHGRLNGINKLCMAAARSEKGIDFDALDDQPVRLIFMMVSPANTSEEHTLALSLLSRIMSYEEVRDKLFNASTPDEFLDIITNAENKYVE